MGGVMSKATAKISIINWITGSVIYESDKPTLKEAVVGAKLYDADLCGADLRGADLRDADLCGAKLYDAKLRGADLRGADLCGAKLCGADLRDAKLCGADLYDADLCGADLCGADLRDAKLCGADLRDAKLCGAKNINDDYTDFWWHIHHEVLVEQLSEPVRARINYIKSDKPKDEVELRLKLLKPVLGKIPTTKTGWNALHKKECGCGWNNKTIFTKKNGLVK
jgi:hypothetical protein